MKRILVLLVLLSCSGAFSQPIATTKVWIFFKDKGPAGLAKETIAYREAVARLSPRAIQRRLKSLPPEHVVDEADLAVYGPYLDRLKRMGIAVRVVSRWLNAASASLSPAGIEFLRQQEFVAEIRPVRKLFPPRPVSSPLSLPRRSQAQDHLLDYGQSLLQNQQLHVPGLHDAGITGEGVIVGMLDAGFRHTGHVAFDSLKILGEFDFVFKDENTADEPGKDANGAQNHGTQTLSTIAGYAPGNLIGPAFGASFYLTKTEDIRSETPIEEDNWVAGIEWLEARGIDVASSSLGYSEFDDPSQNYRFADLDGKTATTTKAAEIAAQKGVVVVVSAGNEGDKPWRHVLTPADGPHVLAIGAVDFDGRRVGFSSLGPTADGRIKPDVMALGSDVTVVQPGSRNIFTTSSGTSFSCPLAAGVVAQMLSAQPFLTPAQTLQALRTTASQAEAPDTLMGFGILDARRAITYWGPAFSNRFTVQVVANHKFRIGLRILSAQPLPEGAAQIHWRAAKSGEFLQRAMAPFDSTLFTAEIPQPEADVDVEVYFTVAPKAGEIFALPVNSPADFFVLNRDGTILSPDIPTAYRIEQNYPNPFAMESEGRTTFILGLPQPAEVTATVYNILGQAVVRLQDRQQITSSQAKIYWDGRDDGGRPVGTGIYFLKIVFRQPGGRADIINKKFSVIR